MVLVYCKQCNEAIHIKTIYRNYLPAFGPARGRRIGHGSYSKCMCNSKDVEQVTQQNSLQKSEKITEQLEEQLKILNKLVKLQLLNLKISRKKIEQRPLIQK